MGGAKHDFLFMLNMVNRCARGARVVENLNISGFLGQADIVSSSGYSTSKTEIIIHSTIDFAGAADIGLEFEFREQYSNWATDAMPIVTLASYSSGTLTNTCGRCNVFYYHDTFNNLYKMIISIQHTYYCGIATVEGCVMPNISWDNNTGNALIAIKINHSSEPITL